MNFVFNQPRQRVRFGAGELDHLAEEVRAIGASKALVLCTPEQTALAQRAAEMLGSSSAGIFSGAVMHVPIEAAREATQVARDRAADCAVAIGGGSTTGLGKAIALETDLPIVAVPTTYAGSEMTPIWGLTEQGVKRTGRDERVLPRSVLYDPILSLTLPGRMSAASGLNAIAHAVEGLYAQDTNPILRLMAKDGIRAICAALLGLPSRPADLTLRSDALYGAWMCGYVLGNASMGLHHKLCHVLGGAFNLPHAELHSVVLPHALAFNQEHAPEALTDITESLALGGADTSVGAPAALQALARANSLPLSLRELGMPEEGLGRALELVTLNQYPNPRPLKAHSVAQLLRRAFDGAAPSP